MSLPIYPFNNVDRNVNDHKVLVMVRQDISIAKQVVHALHANDERPKFFNDKGHPYISLIGVPDEARLLKAVKLLDSLGIRYFLWKDPDSPENGFLSLATDAISKADYEQLMKYRLWRLENTNVPNSNGTTNCSVKLAT